MVQNYLLYMLNKIDLDYCISTGFPTVIHFYHMFYIMTILMSDMPLKSKNYQLRLAWLNL